MDTWQITALDTGSSVIEKSILTYLYDVGSQIRIPRVMWYIAGAKKIIVDTSIESEQVATDIIGENLFRRPEQEPLAALKWIGVDPAAIDYVIFTHLHWDHAGNNHLFPNARFLAQRDEVRYAYAPSSFFEKSFLSPQGGFIPPYLKVRFDLIDGNYEMLPGLELVKCPGHTPGSQAIRVKTRQGWHTITGDAVFTFENLEKMIPPGFHVNIDASLDSMRRIAEISDVVLPSHDYKLFPQDEPQLFGG
ncbi:MAG: N-acyl homoserine lactonase family protein [Thermaerobacter sp.]|nr:N-acyl homoserine lactonase family protein [Thermaerobacter sp.]